MPPVEKDGLTRENEWVPAKDPVHFDKPELVGVGLCSEFARALVGGDPELSIGLIPCAMGGSSIGEWQPGEELYTNAVSRAREAMGGGKLAGILWHQGEADATPELAPKYGERFSAMLARLREDLGAEGAPAIIGELGRFLTSPSAVELNMVLNRLPETVPCCAVVSSEGLVDNGDHLHFDASSLRSFGRRYAEAFTIMSRRVALE